MRIIIQKKERKKKKTAVSGIHTCVVRNYDHHMQTYCTFLPCFTSFFFPFYVARTSILHIHSLSLVMCRYSAFVFFGFFLFFFFSLEFFSSSPSSSSLLCMRMQALRLLCDLMLELDVKKNSIIISYLYISICMCASRIRIRRKGKIACLHNYI